MAKIIKNELLITVSKIAKDEDSSSAFVTEEIAVAIEQIVSELLGDNYVVESTISS